MKEDTNNQTFSSTFRINLVNNTITIISLSDNYKEIFENRIKLNPDYRQTMLTYVLEYVDKNEREKLIQSMLPERLNVYMRSRNKLEIYYHTEIKGIRNCHKLIVEKIENTNDVLLGLVDDADEPGEYIDYIVGSNTILEITNNQSSYLETLNLNNYSIIKQNSIETAKKYLYQHSKNITIIVMSTDFNLNNSIEFIKNIKTNTIYKNIPIVLELNNNEKENISTYVKAGIIDYISMNDDIDISKSRILGIAKTRDTNEMLTLMERDSSSGAYSREFFYKHAAEILNTNKNVKYKIVCMKIEYIQMYNERYGNAITDMLFNYIVSYVNQTIPGIEIVGRIAEDEFAILHKDIDFANKEIFLENLKANAPIQNLTLKIGIVNADNNTPIKTLCDHANVAISQIRKNYEIEYAEYEDSLQQAQQKEHHILSSMENALENNEFKVYYQPKYSLYDNKPGGAEALVRWIHPDYGFMNPAEFIPLFERTGFIRAMDRQIWTKVAMDISKWKRENKKIVPVSINISRRDFETDDLVNFIIGLTKRFDIEPQLLHLEVTESAFTENPEKITKSIKQLHNYGFIIELDDFGSGYSSLNMLNQMEIDYLKIDKSIVVQDNEQSEKNVLEFCIQLANMLHLSTVVEGVETEKQCDRMKKLGCEYIQGYYFSKPLPVEEFEIYLENH